MSRRMGRPKALLPLGGRAMLLHVLDAIDSVEQIERVVVVTGFAADQIRAIAPQRAELIHNPAHATGEMISSVKLGVAAVRGACDAILLALADQPLVKPSTIAKLIDAWRSSPASITLPRCDSKRGHPIVLPASGFDEILSLSDDDTLKSYTSR